MPVKTERLVIDGPTGALEAMIEIPDSEQGSDRGGADGAAKVSWAAVICHPHPQFQGTMLNKVVHTLSRSCTDQGIPALRFNYRGVGQSAGEYDNGIGETEDAAAAVAYMRQRYPRAQIVLAGFSFGSGVAIRLAAQQSAQLLVTVAPPVGRLGVPDSAQVNVPWQVIQGAKDELVDAGAVVAWVNRQAPVPEFVVMEDATHFFHGELTTVRKHVGDFIARHQV